MRTRPPRGLASPLNKAPFTRESRLFIDDARVNIGVLEAALFAGVEMGRDADARRVPRERP